MRSSVSSDGVARPLPAGLTAVTLGPLQTAGLWHVAPVRPPAGSRGTGGPAATFPNAAGWPAGTVPVAVNLADPAESDVRAVAAASAADAGAGVAGGRPWWFLLAAAALGLAAVEWWLYQRRFIQ